MPRVWTGGSMAACEPVGRASQRAFPPFPAACLRTCLRLAAFIVLNATHHRLYNIPPLAMSVTTAILHHGKTAALSFANPFQHVGF